MSAGERRDKACCTLISKCTLILGLSVGDFLLLTPPPTPMGACLIIVVCVYTFEV